MTLFLVITWVEIVYAEWEWRKAIEPHAFSSSNHEYVMAVGKEQELASVEAADISSAILAGKEVRLKHAKVDGDLILPECKVNRRMYFLNTTFSGKLDLHSAVITREVDFRMSSFMGEVDFRSAEFLEKADFQLASFAKGANFSKAIFRKAADFKYVDRFSGHADFRKAIFSDRAEFVRTIFTKSDFSSAQFAGKSSFTWTKFSGNVDFRNAVFSEEADFRYAEFQGADIWFMETDFMGKTIFYSAKFDNMPDFGYAQFAPEADLRHIEFLNEEIPYSHSFYKALIKSYQDSGQWSEADEAYFSYRRRRREDRSGFWELLERVFIEETFGYGVKPRILLRSFLFLWLPFSIFYLFFLHAPERKRNSPWCAIWSLFHSLNNVTPGIELESLTAMLLKLSTYDFRRNSKPVTIAENLQKVFGWYLLALFFVLFGKIWIR
ncbi:pentapeptide repeat-containing protein [Candidatus Poribacteria bacterium]